ncbi:hypothetical protein LCGC14_0469810 [marine sediment metagenome]|uniref:Uncharacterized protein n=1 Tax=marine sediment metagenome TaxID=412755 RepID=A0A0F9UZD9_9ZZZZ
MQPSNYIIAGRLKSVEGDSSLPIAAGHRIIVNLCSTDGEWESSSELGERWEKIKQEYTRWYRSQHKFTIGEVQEINVQSDTCLVNALVYDGDHILDEEAVTEFADKVGNLAKDYSSSVHINGTNDDDWGMIETQLVEKIIKRGVNVTVYGKD